MVQVDPFEDTIRKGGALALEHAGRFFMADDPVHGSLRAIAAKLDELGVPYAIAGGMALVAHGYERTTIDVDILVTAEGLARIHQNLDGRGWVPPFEGSKNLRDTDTGVRIEFLVAGQFPGDGKPKPVAFPDPSQVAVEKDGIRFVDLVPLIELKLASGMTNAGRLKDLADVQELIRALRLTRELGEDLDPFVRDRYRDLWDAVRADVQES
jgi:hypothetical protein